MRPNIWLAGVAAVLGLGLVLTPASANGPTKNGANKNGTSNTVTALHEAKLLLDTAIHDYDGHRAKAVEEVHHAIRELAPQQKGNTGGKGNKAANATNKANNNAGKGATTAPGENQGQSDVQLKQALQILGGVGTELPNAKANVHIQNAITELKTALKIK